MDRTCLRQPAGALRISVIVPAYNAADHLGQSLPALIAMRDSGDVLEVIVADDASTDDTHAVASSLGAQVIRNLQRGGPGAARNLAAHQARGDIIWFVDADVVAHADGVRILGEAFAEDDVVAVHGSYDDAPPADNFASQYKNLIHRFYHQQGKREASTFWAGLGAVRKTAFLAVGGFDTAHFDRVEDIDLGYRMRAAGGRILLIHNLLGTHLKRWTLSSVVMTDIFRRALPWARMMITRDGLTDDLNVAWPERFRAAFAGLLLLSAITPLFAPLWFWLPGAFFAGAIAINWRLFNFFRRSRGPGFAVLALLSHQAYYLYSAAAFVWCVLEVKLARKGTR